MVSLIFVYWLLISSHPEVAIANSAHIHSVLRRMSSLHRVKDAGSILAAQDRSGAALRVRHDPQHVPAGVAHAGDGIGRPVRIVTHVAPHDAAVRLELGGGALVRHIAAVAVGERDLQDLAWLRSEEHTSELQSLAYLVCRLLLEKKN